MTLDEIKEKHGRTWEISTELYLYVAAWRHKFVPYESEFVNVLLARDLDALDEKLTRQGGMECQTNCPTSK